MQGSSPLQLSLALSRMGVSFVPLLTYLPQENGEAARLNRTLGDMAQAMLTQSDMPTHFWHYVYASACYIHNRLPNLQCANSSPYQELFGWVLEITTLYPFGVEAIVHLPPTHQAHKLAPRGVQWTNKLIQSESMVFTQLQPERVLAGRAKKGTLPHIPYVMSLGEVLTKKYMADKNKAISLLPLAKDITIPEHLGQALGGPQQGDWQKVCLAELDQMKQRDVWEVINKMPGMTPSSHRWVFDIKHNPNGTVERFKAQMVARGDHQ
ncbi:hypothetical protein O181_012408 [Austropuccinia psidii MF-1]|uniref:Integrase catalytic domain-containing protein n=1 Tax=Austropuccinia psidii MF-1 TaxID=1389203 RepID=A0A9Q3BX88_9BASI|nr:hypothetical protein [Austropuccinia psidii MF-1]